MRTTDDLVPTPAGRRGRDDITPRRSDDTASPLLGAVRSVLRALTSLSPLPVGRERLLWVFRRPSGGGVAEAYVVVWVAALTVGLAFADTDAGPYVAGVALFRYGDLMTTRAVVLLDPVGLRVGDARRALVLSGLHLVELVLVTATIFRWQLNERIGSAFITGFDVVTFQWPARYPGNWLEVTRGLAGAGAIVMGATLIAVVVRMGRARP